MIYQYLMQQLAEFMHLKLSLFALLEFIPFCTVIFITSIMTVWFSITNKCFLYALTVVIAFRVVRGAVLGWWRRVVHMGDCPSNGDEHDCCKAYDDEIFIFPSHCMWLCSSSSERQSNRVQRHWHVHV